MDKLVSIITHGVYFYVYFYNFRQYGNFSHPCALKINFFAHGGRPVDRRPSTAEAPQISQIYPFSKRTVTFEPVM